MNNASLFEAPKSLIRSSRALTQACIKQMEVKEILSYYSIPTAPHYLIQKSYEFDKNGYIKVKDKYPLIVKVFQEKMQASELKNKSIVYNEAELKQELNIYLMNINSRL